LIGTLNGKSKERWRWFDHPPVQPLLWCPELVPTMLVSRRLLREDNRVDLGSAFEALEPYAGKLARTVLRGAGDRKALGLLGGIMEELDRRMEQWRRAAAVPAREVRCEL
jgi:hypothetical protein